VVGHGRSVTGVGGELPPGADPGPLRDLGVEVEPFDRGLVLVGAPLVAGQHPHDLELVAVGVGAVQAQGGAVAGLAGERACLGEAAAGVGELIDGVELPGEVVEPDRAAALGATGAPDAEQPEVVMVARAWQAEERGVGAGFTGDDLHAEHLGVEGQRAFEVGDEQHGVVEADGEKAMAGSSRCMRAVWGASGAAGGRLPARGERAILRRSLVAEISNSRVTFSETSTPPASSAVFQFRPQSLRLTWVVPSNPTRSVAPRVDGGTGVLEVDGDGLGDATQGQVPGDAVVGVADLLDAGGDET
jgi:hypothetical protein